MSVNIEKESSVLFVSKRPDTTNTFELDWTNVLDAGEAIAGQTTTAPAGITVADSGVAGATTYHSLSGGDAGTEYDLTVEIVTSATPARTIARTLRVFIIGTAITLDATVGGASANAYLTVSEANSYLIHRPRANDWFVASTHERINALVTATELLDRYVKWNGEKADDAQALEWPRNYAKDRYGRNIDNTIVPQAVKNATALLAEVLLTDDVQADPDNKGISSMAVPGVVSLNFDKYDRKKILPEAVTAQIRGLGTIHGYTSVVDVVRA